MKPAILSQAEIAEIQRIFENPVLKSALDKFCEYKAQSDALECKNYLIGSQRNVDAASAYAAGSACYESFMAELRVFVKDEIERS